MWCELEKVFLSVNERHGWNADEEGLPLPIPYSRQGSYGDGEELPEAFFTFWNAETPEDLFYDNNPTRVTWRWLVYFYTSDSDKVFSLMDEFIEEARRHGFLVDGRARDIPSNEPGYIGRYVAVLYEQRDYIQEA